jgi:predicted MFS family arabinose efflux permease
VSRRLTLLFAIAGGAAVGNLYWAQPLLDFIARDLRTDTAVAGALVTATQLGYALGVLLLVPLGDVLNRRVLVPVALLCAAVALLASALAPTFSRRWPATSRTTTIAAASSARSCPGSSSASWCPARSAA